MNKISIKYKITAIILSIAFIFQSLQSINEHTYKSTGVSIHSERGCIQTIPNHISYYCNEFH